MRPGELWPAERQFLFQAIVEKKPKIVLEIGTGGGDGSTYQIAKALKENLLTNQIKGYLHTCEVDLPSFEQAKTKYSTPEWNEIVVCWQKFSYDLIDTLIEQNDLPDFIFFDGPEDPNIAFSDFKTLEACVKPGTYFGMHDWDCAGSTKANLLRPYLETSKNWSILRSLTAPNSVGIVLAEKHGG